MSEAWQETWEPTDVTWDGDDGTQVSAVTVESYPTPGLVVCSVWRNTSGERHLIAAAPEMARVLLECARFVDKAHDRVPDGGLRQRIEAVLRKAAVPRHREEP